jgi:hypothetical protein
LRSGDGCGGCQCAEGEPGATTHAMQGGCCAGQSHLKELAPGFGRTLLERHGKGAQRLLEMWQGLKPGLFLRVFGTTEVMPCYKARFGGVFTAN